MPPYLQRRIAFACIMALVTGSFTSTINILRNHGFTSDFPALWLHAMQVTYPTIVFCIMVIAPYVQRWLGKIFPDTALQK